MNELIDSKKCFCCIFVQLIYFTCFNSRVMIKHAHLPIHRADARYVQKLSTNQHMQRKWSVKRSKIKFSSILFETDLNM